MPQPNTLFGGALIGTSFTTSDQVQELLDLLKTLGINRIDTTARYSPTAPGSSERLLGETRAAEQGFTIDTKINAANGEGAGSLTAAATKKSLEESLSRLQTSKVNVLHFHRPDPQTPVAEQAAEIHRQYVAGRFDKFGLSNFPLEMVADFISICEDKSYAKPSVYQGLYNLLSRESEETLLPLLRMHNIAFNLNAYSEEDGVILGASKLPQIVQNMADISKGPLPTDVVQKIDLVWEKSMKRR